VTNGITHRRWLCQANPPCAPPYRLIGPAFYTDASKLHELKSYADDPSVLSRLAEIKQANKQRFSNYLNKTADVLLEPSFLFDVQVKRLHEYKRQEMNILHVLYLYLTLKENPQLEMQPGSFSSAPRRRPDTGWQADHPADRCTAKRSRKTRRSAKSCGWSFSRTTV
jgi:starch phosphorylase